MSEDKNKPGFQRVFKDEDFLKALDEIIPHPTSQIRKAVGCAHDTASRKLKDLEKEGFVESVEIEAGTGTGKMYLWTITEAGIKKLKDQQED